MKQKISLQQLIDEDLLEIPEPDLEFTLGEVTGSNYKGLRASKGFYTFTKDNIIIYVGVSGRLGYRMYDHSKVCRNDTLKGKLVNKGMSVEGSAEYIKTIKVNIFYEEEPVFQDLYEKYLLSIYRPLFNKDIKPLGRAGGAVTSVKESLKILAISKYKQGMPITEIVAELGISRYKLVPILEEYGLTIRPTGAKTRVNIEKIVNGKEKGLTLTEIALENGCSIRTVSSHLKKYRESQQATATTTK